MPQIKNIRIGINRAGEWAACADLHHNGGQVSSLMATGETPGEAIRSLREITHVGAVIMRPMMVRPPVRVPARPLSVSRASPPFMAPRAPTASPARSPGPVRPTVLARVPVVQVPASQANKPAFNPMTRAIMANLRAKDPELFSRLVSPLAKPPENASSPQGSPASPGGGGGSGPSSSEESPGEGEENGYESAEQAEAAEDYSEYEEAASETSEDKVSGVW